MTATPLGGVITGSLAQHRDGRGTLGIAEFAEVLPFQPVRLFWITDVPQDTARGGHAHKLCSQFMICAIGHIRIDACDGFSERSFELHAGDYLHVPPAIYADVVFAVPRSTLLVLCDRPYEAADYVEDRAALPLAGE